MTKTRIVRCAPPAGCGWWWEWHVLPRVHWWSRKRDRLYGPFWPDTGISGGAPRWMTWQRHAEEYPDCVPHLRVYVPFPDRTNDPRPGTV